MIPQKYIDLLIRDLGVDIGLVEQAEIVNEDAVAGVLLLVSAAFGAAMVVAIFANDLPTLSCLAAAALATGAVAFARARSAPWIAAAALAFAMGTSMLPGLPVVNGLIARILANSTKRL